MFLPHTSVRRLSFFKRSQHNHISKKKSSSVRVLLVGAGRMGKIRASLLHANPRFDLCGLVDPMGWSSELPNKYMIPVFDTVPDAVKTIGQNNPSSLPQALVVSCPTPARREIIIQAARHKLNVFTEKPVGETAEQIQELFGMAHGAGIQLCCGFQRRFDSSYKAASDAVLAGNIGRPIAAHLFFADHPVPPREFLLQGGDIFMDLAAHDVDFITNILSRHRVTSVFASASSSDSELAAAGVHDNATVLLKLEGGVVVTLFLSRAACYGYDQRCEIFGTKGMVSVGNHHAHSAVLSNSSGIHRSLLQNSFPERFREAFSEELDEFANVLLNGESWPVTRDQCVLVQAIADAARLSAQQGVPVLL